MRYINLHFTYLLHRVRNNFGIICCFLFLFAQFYLSLIRSFKLSSSFSPLFVVSFVQFQQKKTKKFCNQICLIRLSCFHSRIIYQFL